MTLLSLPIADLHAQSADAYETFRVGRDSILKAMLMQKQEGYDLTATTNGSRFQGGVILQLVRWARQKDPDGPPLFIHHEDSFWAYLQATGLTKEQAPAFVHLAYQHKQDHLIEHRRNRVIEEVQEGAQPALTVNVKAWWPASPDLSPTFSYLDKLSSPPLHVTNRRVITYRLLQFADMTVYDEIRGVSGRPAGGLLGLVFDVIGEGRVVHSRFAVSRDGLQVTYSRAEKGIIKVEPTTTIRPNGQATEGLPQDRPDLLPIEAKLKRPLRINYVPFNWP